MAASPQGLSVARAKDRAAMADQLVILAQSLGADTEIHSWVNPHPHEIWIHIRAARGLCLTIDLDRNSRQQREGTWVLSWHMASGSEAKLEPSFGDVNPYHFRKATAVAYSFADLLTKLAQGLSMARDGSAFQSGGE